MGIFGVVDLVARHYQRQAGGDAASEDDPYAFTQEDVARLIPYGDEHEEFLSGYVDALSTSEESRRTTIVQKAIILAGSAGISVTFALAISGFLLNGEDLEVRQWGVPIVLLILALAFFTWSALVSLATLRVEQFQVPDPLALESHVAERQPILSLTRQQLLAWSRNKDTTNQLAYLLQIALERFVLGVFLAFAAVVAFAVAAAIESGWQ